MRSPYDDLGKPRLDNPQGEECEGAFTCQEDGCDKVATEARYLREVQILTWLCPDGHLNKIEGFRIE